MWLRTVLTRASPRAGVYRAHFVGLPSAFPDRRYVHACLAYGQYISTSVRDIKLSQAGLLIVPQ